MVTVIEAASFPPCALCYPTAPSSVSCVLLCCVLVVVVSKGMQKDRYLCELKSSLWSHV